MGKKPDQRIALEERAKASGVEFTLSLGYDKLEQRIKEAVAKAKPAGEDKTFMPPPLVPSDLAKPVVIPNDALSDDEQAALIADPKLSVETFEAD